MDRSITFALLIALGLPIALQAQLRGHVVGPTGQRVRGALVELWEPTRRAAQAITDSEGQFSFPQVHSGAPLVVLVRRVGFAPARVAVKSSVVVVLMTPFAEVRRAIAANANLCPRSEQPEARHRWDAVRQRYAPRSLAYWSEARVSMAQVRPEALGVVDTSTIGPGQIAAGGHYFEEQSARIAEHGYAVPFAGLRQPRFDLWEYPRLESLLAAHFTDSLFGNLHTLSWFDSGQTSLVFCPRDRDRAGIEGIIVASPDSSLELVRWSFVTPAPHEDAGGEVLFTAPGLEARPPLLPAVGLFWRKRVFGYYQEWWEFQRWQTCRTDPDPRFCR